MTSNLRRMVSLVLKHFGLSTFPSCQHVSQQAKRAKQGPAAIQASRAFRGKRELRAERAAAGRASAKARGQTGGRPRTDIAKLENARILYQNSDQTAAVICKSVGIGRRTFFAYLAEQRRSTSAE